MKPHTLEFKKSYNFLADYFINSKYKYKWPLVFGCLLCIIALIGFGFALGWWLFPLITSAIIAKNTLALITILCAGIGLATAITATSYLFRYLKYTLYIDWRSWLMKKIINQYLNNKTNYLKISRLYPEIDNPEQRIQEDIDKIVDKFIDLSLGCIENFSNLISHIILLGLIGSFLISSALVLSALALSILTSTIGYYINRKLSASTNDETIIQSNIRADLQHIKTFSEEIAIEHAEKYYHQRLEEEIEDLNTKTAKKQSIQNNTESFNTFNNLIQYFLPFLAAAPLYFNNIISLQMLNTVGYYFSMITSSFNWFLNSFDKFNKLQTSLQRIIILQETLENNDGQNSSAEILRKFHQEDKKISIKNLNLHLPGSNKVLIKGINIEFKPRINTLIQAPSGTGKSSLFKAIAGTWVSGEGEITIPHSQESIYFLPQQPTLPKDSLRNVLNYPDVAGHYRDEELIAALKIVHLEHLTDKLDQIIGFKSLGEQQRLAFARLFIRKPDWIFLDEATASLDEQLEEEIYTNLKNTLPDTTIVSIAHRSTVKRYHDNIVFFQAQNKEEEEIMIQKLFLA